MKRIIFALALGLGLGVFGTVGARAADADLAAAISHTEDAINQGKLGYPASLAMQADLALEAAEASEKHKPNPHTTEAVTHLKAAIEEGRARKDAKAGLQHAEEALKHLQEAAK
jgi:hypothetical protein